MDFTIKKYKYLLDTLLSQGYSFVTFRDYLEKQQKKCIILRHDVDKTPENSLHFARIQTKKGILGTYYFRMVKCSYNEEYSILNLEFAIYDYFCTYEFYDYKGRWRYTDSVWLSLIYFFDFFFVINNHAKFLNQLIFCKKFLHFLIYVTSNYTTLWFK